ncbi:hypothetical protein [Sneathiella sp. HT1-7]|uniref:hypothetical protein n=1 Tax=Sneathiella sp. HT1-7 TaxID=2887192 RepID=UPI001D138E7A|nr:hypothetical protein [Sneathiella sp. HT1-7]MCC3305450.1 hypothetical protein [Sneathiella sp. HT1-7]
MTVAEKIEMPTKSPTGDAGPLLGGRFRIDVSRRLVDMENGDNMVVQATDVQNPSAEYFAVISNPYSSFRLAMAQIMSEIHIPGMVDLMAHGKVQFSEIEACYVSVFEMPRGGRLYREGDAPLPEILVLDLVVSTVATCLLNLQKNGMTHRGIRADNLFVADNSQSEFLLGEAITMAPGSAQPAVYEPLECVMAHPMGRGDGSPSDDIYATGVLILHLVGGKLPAADLSPDEIYTKKLELGSFAALTEGMSLSTRVSDVLAGTLHDDPKRRWDAETLLHWREAIGDTPRRGRGDRHAFGKILFQSEEYSAPRVLAHAMTRKSKAALELIENGKLAKWVKSALRDEDAATKIEQIQASANSSRGDKRFDTAAVAQAVRLLDPDGIFWYRNVAFGRGALGPLLLWAFQNDDAEMKKDLMELLETALLQTVSVEETRSSKGRQLEWVPESALTRCYDYMRRKRDVGYGLERCLYELNPKTPCLSPLVLGSHVRNVPEFIEIAEKKLAASNGQGNPFDRHSAAFITSKAKGLDKYLRMLAASAPGTSANALAQIKLFAKLQAAAHPGPLPGFCRWMEETQKPVLAKIRSRLRREVVSQKFQEAKKSGNLAAILKETDIERQLAEDTHEYEIALATSAESERIAAYLEGASEQRRQDAAHYGIWITSVLAITTLVTSMTISALYFLG